MGGRAPSLGGCVMNGGGAGGPLSSYGWGCRVRGAGYFASLPAACVYVCGGGPASLQYNGVDHQEARGVFTSLSPSWGAGHTTHTTHQQLARGLPPIRIRIRTARTRAKTEKGATTLLCRPHAYTQALRRSRPLEFIREGPAYLAGWPRLPSGQVDLPTPPFRPPQEAPTPIKVEHGLCLQDHQWEGRSRSSTRRPTSQPRACSARPHSLPPAASSSLADLSPRP